MLKQVFSPVLFCFHENNSLFLEKNTFLPNRHPERHHTTCHHFWLFVGQTLQQFFLKIKNHVWCEDQRSAFHCCAGMVGDPESNESTKMIFKNAQTHHNDFLFLDLNVHLQDLESLLLRLGSARVQALGDHPAAHLRCCSVK